MPRRSRIVLPNLAHHVVQRGSRRGQVFFCDEDRLINPARMIFDKKS